jgi:hypothetical protein
MIKLLFITIIILGIIYSILYYYKNKNIENFSDKINEELTEISISNLNKNKNNKSDIEINREKIEDINKFEKNNLIQNGNFENKKNPVNHINQSGYNKIILKKNPGKSSYVLEQKNIDKENNLTYYELLCSNDKNNKYVLYFWLCIGDSSIEELDFNKLINIKIENEDFSNYIPKINYNIIQKIILSTNDTGNLSKNSWYLIKYDFISGGNTKDKMHIYLNYSERLQYSEYYFTDISLYKVLIDAENFIYNDKLICYTDGYNYQSNIPTWHDLSGNGNDMFWSNIPKTDSTIGSLNTLGLKLVGFPSNKISNNNFTILFCLNKNIENIASDNSVNEKNSNMDFYLINIPGNDRFAFELKIKDNYLYLINAKNEFKSKNELILYNKSLLSIIYDDNIIHVFLDGINIMSEKVNKLYFSNDTFIINKNKNLNYNIYGVLFYNRIVYKKELNEIRDYFITNKDKNFNTPDINVHHMYNSAEYTINNSDYMNKNIIKSSEKSFNTNDTVNNNNNFIDTFDNKNYKETCLNDCNKLCDQFIDKVGCITNCKNVLLPCNKYCNDSSNTDNIYCGSTKDTISCPKVYKKDGNFMVFVSPDSYYSKMYNYSGERSYGNNIEKAKYIYNLNFPNCVIPPELLPGEGKSYTETCPFVINELNPCHTSACANVKWNVNNYNDLNLNKNCKKAVSNYCQINYNIDDNCSCWHPKNKNNQKCIEFRRYFEDPNDYCSPNQFKIEEHPDYDKYIKKDSIPCWGCSL